MLRPLLLAVALGSAAAQSCNAAATVKTYVCSAATGSDPPWSCIHNQIQAGDTVPLAIGVENTCSRGTEAENNLESLTAKLNKDGQIFVFFACAEQTCRDPVTDARSWYDNVLVYANTYTPNVEGQTSYVNGVGDQLGRGTITINVDIPMTAQGTGSIITLGSIYTTAVSKVELATGITSFNIYGTSSSGVISTTELDKCDPPAGGTAGGGTAATWPVVNPPPPPPPPDCCTDFSRACLARCEQCYEPGAVNVDAKGEPCGSHCFTTCSAYPSTESKACFNRCTGCSQLTTLLDTDGRSCSAGACDDCFAYDKCMKGGNCVVGCVAGRRERKLLFAPIPVCTPCCKPIVV